MPLLELIMLSWQPEFSKFISPPLLPSMNSPPSLTTCVFCMRSKMQKTVRPLSLSGSFLVFFFFLSHGLHFRSAQHVPSEVHEITPSLTALCQYSQAPGGLRCLGARLRKQSSAVPPSPSAGSRYISSCFHKPQTCRVLFFTSSPPKH